MITDVDKHRFWNTASFEFFLKWILQILQETSFNKPIETRFYVQGFLVLKGGD